MSKAQVEIFGLVIIVILIAAGLLIAVTILAKIPTKEVQKVKESVQAANFLNTIMATTSDCEKRSVRELIQDCAVSSYKYATPCGNGANTCEKAEEMIREMLKQTLGKWGKEYYFYMKGTESVEMIKIGTDCKGEREGSTRPEKIRPGLDVTATLQICQS